MSMRNKNIVQINHSLLESMGVSSSMQPTDYAIIRSWGDKNSAVTYDGKKVEREEYIFSPEYNAMVRCVPYELHFVYKDPDSDKLGRWSYMCTCGSIAGIISYKDVKDLMSPTLGEYVLACIVHTASKQNTGVGSHADGSHE